MHSVCVIICNAFYVRIASAAAEGSDYNRKHQLFAERTESSWYVMMHSRIRSNCTCVIFFVTVDSFWLACSNILFIYTEIKIMKNDYVRLYVLEERANFFPHLSLCFGSLKNKCEAVPCRIYQLHMFRCWFKDALNYDEYSVRSSVLSLSRFRQPFIWAT